MSREKCLLLAPPHPPKNWIPGYNLGWRANKKNQMPTDKFNKVIKMGAITKGLVQFTFYEDFSMAFPKWFLFFVGYLEFLRRTTKKKLMLELKSGENWFFWRALIRKIRIPLGKLIFYAFSMFVFLFNN